MEMEERMVKFYSEDSNKLSMHCIPGHFATSNSHINYYIDVTSVKTRASEAKEAARLFYAKMPRYTYIDTLVCMDGTDVIGAFLSEKIEEGGILSTNQHETTYIVFPEINSNGQLMFRDNNKPAIKGKHVMILLATATTGETIRRAISCIRYYGGIVEGVGAIFSTVKEAAGIEVLSLFNQSNILNYEVYSVGECPFCKKGYQIEAIVNGFGYSKL